LERSIEIFKELATEDADNGAHSYFLASALRQSGGKKEEVRAAFNQSVKTSKFDPFYQSIYDSLQSIAYTNSATFTWVHSFLETMPMPDYDLGIRYLKYWAHEEETGKWIAHRLAKRLIDIGSKYKTHSPGYQFSRSEYLLGENLKYTVEGKMEKSWEDYMNRMREAQNFISETPRPVVDAEINIYREKIEGKKSCGPDAWRSLFTAYKSKKES
jgi:tetratricopeptide (TPR) repeat protein